jgi:hypothetical protein
VVIIVPWKIVYFHYILGLVRQWVVLFDFRDPLTEHFGPLLRSLRYPLQKVPK